MSLKPEQMFSHYRLVEKIGEGGMGVVWRAEDTVLQRAVAIKFLRGDVSHEQFLRERFLKEARLASSVSDAHIAQVHDFGHDQNLDFLVMEYVEGDPLHRILEGRALPVHRIVNIGHQIAKALAKAHRNNLLHRDLKPANVLITPDGDVKVVDFGLARLFRREDSIFESAAITLSIDSNVSPETTQSGIAGTLPYMSPEQVRGDKLDARSDIFSLGTILFEMTTGKEPFIGASNLEIAQEIEKCRPVPVHDLVPAVPLDLERTIQKAMARQRADRYQTMEDMAVDLKRLSREIRSGSAPSYEELHKRVQPKRLSPGAMALGLVAAVVLTVVAWGYCPGRPGDSEAGDGPPIGGDGDPPLEEVTNAEVFYNRGLFYFLKEEETARSIGDSIQMFHRGIELEADHARAWAMLGEAYWRRYHKWGRDPASRDEAIKAVDEAFRLDPDLAEAHHARGYGFISEGEFEPAEEPLRAAVVADPRFDRAWANLGLIYRKLGEYQPGLEALQKAVALKPDDFRHQIRLGNFYGTFSEYDEAVVAYQDALALKPDSVMAWSNLGGTYLKMDEVEEADRAFQRAFEIDETASARSNLGTEYYFKGEYEKAAENYQRATELNPEHSVPWRNLGDALKMLGRSSEAQAAYKTAVMIARFEVRLAPGDADLRTHLGISCAHVGDAECALREGRIAADLAPQNSNTLFGVAVMFHLVGHTDEALDWLEIAVKLGLSKAEIENDPNLTGLHDDPRYLRILGLAS